MKGAVAISLALCLAGAAASLYFCPDAYARKSSKKAAAKKWTPEFVQATRDFAQGKYKVAAEKFENADRTGLCCDKTHYYLALCYHNLNQTNLAGQHYSWVYSYSKDPLLKYQAQVGFESVSRYASSRQYAGQGNTFVGWSASSGRAGGGGGGG